MISIVLATALLLSTPAPLTRESNRFSVGDLTGGTELKELREAVLQERLPVSVRRASLDRYAEILTSGHVDVKAEEIASNIREFVEPTADAGFDVKVLSADEFQVSGTMEQLIWVESFLEASAEMGFLDSQVYVQVEIFQLPAGGRANLIGAERWLTLTAADLDVLRAKIAKLEDAELVNAPGLLMNVGAPASLSVSDETAYIKDVELTFFPDMKKAVVDPVVGVVQEGFFMDVRALPIAKDTLMLKTNFRWVTLQRPLGEETRDPMGLGDEVTVQVPELREVKAAAQFELKGGTSMLLSTVDPGFDGEEEQDVMVLIKAALVEKPDGTDK